MSPSKEEVITFKADPDLAAGLRGLPNRSEFIRRAVRRALHLVCAAGEAGPEDPPQRRAE